MCVKTELAVVVNKGVKKEVIYEACSKDRSFVSFEVIHNLTTVCLNSRSCGYDTQKTVRKYTILSEYLSLEGR